MNAWVWYGGGWWWCIDWGRAWACEGRRRWQWVDGLSEADLESGAGSWVEESPWYWVWERDEWASNDGWSWGYAKWSDALP